MNDEAYFAKLDDDFRKYGAEDAPPRRRRTWIDDYLDPAGATEEPPETEEE